MGQDGPPVPPSNAPTPMFSPLPSGVTTPQPSSSNTAGDYLSAPLAKKTFSQPKTYLAGSKALDSLARMIASTESFFHPSNSGSWTADVRTWVNKFYLLKYSFGISLQLSAFIKYIVYDFNKSMAYYITTIFTSHCSLFHRMA